MYRTNLSQQQRIRLMQFEHYYNLWTESKLTQEEAARELGVDARTFRRHIARYEKDDFDGIFDRRELSHTSSRCAPVDEVMKLVNTYRENHKGWSVNHFHSWYQRYHGGTRSYSWTLRTLHRYDAITPAPARGKHFEHREPSAMPGMMLHQDASTHEWVPGKYWDLVVTMDDATNEHYSMFFCDQEGTASSFRGIRDVIEALSLIHI